MLRQNLDRDKDLLESIAPSGTHAGLTITLVFAKIGMIQDTAPLVTAVSIFTIDQTTKLGGNSKETSKGLKSRDGEE
jgi:hypothetical protein